LSHRIIVENNDAIFIVEVCSFSIEKNPLKEINGAATKQPATHKQKQIKMK
jgi:hypothetical protein